MSGKEKIPNKQGKINVREAFPPTLIKKRRGFFFWAREKKLCSVDVTRQTLHVSSYTTHSHYRLALRNHAHTKKAQAKKKEKKKVVKRRTVTFFPIFARSSFLLENMHEKKNFFFPLHFSQPACDHFFIARESRGASLSCAVELLEAT
jgi:hypothetical protein